MQGSLPCKQGSLL